MDLAELSRSIKHEAASAQRDTTARNNPHIHHTQQTSSMSNAEDPVKAEGKGAEDANIVSIKVRRQVAFYMRSTHAIHWHSAISTHPIVFNISQEC